TPARPKIDRDHLLSMRQLTEGCALSAQIGNGKIAHRFMQLDCSNRALLPIQFPLQVKTEESETAEENEEESGFQSRHYSYPLEAGKCKKFRLWNEVGRLKSLHVSRNSERCRLELSSGLGWASSFLSEASVGFCFGVAFERRTPPPTRFSGN